MMSMVSSIAQLDMLVKDDQNEMPLDFFSHLTLVPLASASCDADGTIVFIRSRQLKQYAVKL